MPNIDVPQFSEEDFNLIVEALSLWAESHPKPDFPVIGFAGNEPITPAQLISEVLEETQNGKSFIRMLQVCIEVMPLEEILERFNPRQRLTL
ncbi:MAG: hypothetical protein V3U87_09565 [Methylococcaceae bacterium]